MDNVTLRLLQCCAINIQKNLPEIKQLLLKGANINEQGKNLWTPLIWACESDCTEIAELFIEQGANVNIVNDRDITPLMYSCDKLNQKLVSLLISKGADVNAITVNGDSVLHKVPLGWKKTLHIVKVLVDAGANVNFKNKNCRSFLFEICCRSVKSDDLEVAKFLIAKGADINTTDNNNMNILRWLCNDDKKIKYIEWLLKSGINVNAQDNNGNTALIMASRLLIISIVTSLLKYNADTSIKNNDGQWALDIVKKSLQYYKNAKNASAEKISETMISLLEEATETQKINKLLTHTNETNFSI